MSTKYSYKVLRIRTSVCVFRVDGSVAFVRQSSTNVIQFHNESWVHNSKATGIGYSLASSQ